MSDYCSVQDRNDFNEKIFEIIQEYLNNTDSYQKEVGISIEPRTLALDLCTKDDCTPNLDWYDINNLITEDEDGNMEPDCDATYDLASSDCFIE